METVHEIACAAPLRKGHSLLQRVEVRFRFHAGHVPQIDTRAHEQFVSLQPLFLRLLRSFSARKRRETVRAFRGLAQRFAGARVIRPTEPPPTRFATLGPS